MITVRAAEEFAYVGAMYQNKSEPQTPERPKYSAHRETSRIISRFSMWFATVSLLLGALLYVFCSADEVEHALGALLSLVGLTLLLYIYILVSFGWYITACGGTHTTKSAPVYSPDSALRQAVCYFHEQTNKASAKPHSSAYTNAQICLMNEAKSAAKA